MIFGIISGFEQHLLYLNEDIRLNKEENNILNQKMELLQSQKELCKNVSGTDSLRQFVDLEIKLCEDRLSVCSQRAKFLEEQLSIIANAKNRIDSKIPERKNELLLSVVKTVDDFLEAAFLEHIIGQKHFQENAPDKAFVSLISEASCLASAMQIILEKAKELAPTEKFKLTLEKEATSLSNFLEK